MKAWCPNEVYGVILLPFATVVYVASHTKNTHTLRRTSGTAWSVKSAVSVSEIKLLGIDVILVFEGNLLLEGRRLYVHCQCTTSLLPNNKDRIYEA